MPRYDFSAPRLFFEERLGPGQRPNLNSTQANYVLSVLRMREGERILIFNGRDGEWLAELTNAGRRKADLSVLQQTRPQESGPDIDYCFAPLKHARLDYMVQKAVEMGARAPPPGHDQTDAGFSRQPFAHARQCDRGGRAMRHSDDC